MCSLLCSTGIHNYSYEMGFVPSVGKTGLSKWQITVSRGTCCQVGRQKNQWTINEKDIRLQKQKSEEGHQEKKILELARVFKARWRNWEQEEERSAQSHTGSWRRGWEKNPKLVDSVAVYPVPGLCLPLFQASVGDHWIYVLSSTLCCLATCNCSIQTAFDQFLVLLKDDLHLYCSKLSHTANLNQSISFSASPYPLPCTEHWRNRGVGLQLSSNLPKRENYNSCIQWGDFHLTTSSLWGSQQTQSWWPYVLFTFCRREQGMEPAGRAKGHWILL